MLTKVIKTSLRKTVLHYSLCFLFSFSSPIFGMDIVTMDPDSEPEEDTTHYSYISDPEGNGNDSDLHFQSDFNYYPQQGVLNEIYQNDSESETSSEVSTLKDTGTSSQIITETSTLITPQSSSEWSSQQPSPVIGRHNVKLIKLFELSKEEADQISNSVSQRELTSLSQQPESLNTLEKIRFTNGDDTEMSAFTIYKGSQFQTNPELKFMLQMDEHFFRKAPLAENFGQGMCGAIFWPTVTFANAGVVMYTTGDFLRIHYGQSGAIVQVTWLLASHAPVYARQFYRIAQSIGDTLTCKSPFKTSAEDDDPYTPHIYQKWRSHYLMNAGAIFAASIHATTSMFFFFLAEAPFPIFAWTTGGFVFLSELERYAARANLDIDRRFTHAYDTAEDKRQEALHKKDKRNVPQSPYGINKMRKYLLLKTERFRYELDNDDFANATYDIIRKEIDKTDQEESINPKSYYFKMSLLFLRDLSFFGTFDHKSNIEKPQKEQIKIERKGTDSPLDRYNSHYTESERKIKGLGKRIQELEEQNQKLLNRKRMEQTLEPTLLDDVRSRISSGLIDAAWFARWAGMGYLLETTFIGLFSTDPTLATILALGLSGYEVLFKSSTEYSIQKKYLAENLNNPFSLRNHVTLPWLRKPVGGSALVNGVFTALGKTVASLLAFNRWQIPLPFQIVAVASEFVVNTSYYAQFHEQETQNLITDLGTAYSTNKALEEMTITEKRLWLHHWSNTIIPYLETGFDGRTIQLLFQISQRAI